MAEYGGRAEEDARELEPVENQAGILALDGGRLRRSTCSASAQLERAAHRLASSYMLGGMDDLPEFASRPRHPREEWLRTIAAAPVNTRPSAGLGRQVVLSDPQLVGGGLWHEGRPAHLSVFGAAARHAARSLGRQRVIQESSMPECTPTAAAVRPADARSTMCPCPSPPPTSSRGGSARP